MPPAKPKLAQEDWDEAVVTNIEDFGMTPEEAVAAAAEEFAPRYDLSAVVRAGAAAAAAHPVALAAAALRAAVEEEEGGSGSSGSSSSTHAGAAAAAAVESAVAALAEACFPAAEEDRQPALAVAAKEEAAALLLRAVAAAAPADGPPLPLLLPALRLLRRLLLRSADARAAFLQAGGVERCTDWLARSLLGVAAGGGSRDWRAAALVAAACEAACFKSEEAKCRFASYVPPAGPLEIAAAAATARVDADEEQAAAVGAGGFVSLLLKGVLASPEAPPAAVAGAAGVLRALTYADDESALASRAFTHARLLAKAHGALRELLFALQRLSSCSAEGEEEEEEEDDDEAAAAAAAAADGGDGKDALPSTRAEAVAAVLAAVRSVAANDDACRGFSDDGGVRACLALLRRAVERSSSEGEGGGGGGGGSGSASRPAPACPAALARSAAGALRQLANSDPVKEQLAGEGALDVIVGAIGRFSGGGSGGGKSVGGGGGKAGGDAADADDPDDQQGSCKDGGFAARGDDALEPVAGLLAAMTLRQPEVTAAAADAGAVEALCAALGRLVAASAAAAAADEGNKAPPPQAAPPSSSSFSCSANNSSSSNAAACCRQLCLAARNMACRGGPGVRAAFLAAGAEPLLRAAKRAHPAACRDVGSAALRDLGLDNYNA
jgi:hypothetical protein